MAHKLEYPQGNAQGLTCAVLQATEMLGMYRAELARVLHVRCGDVGELAERKALLEPGSNAWEQAKLFVRFYNALYDMSDGDSVAMYHWLRADNRALQGSPVLLIVDEGQLQLVIEYIESLHLASIGTSTPGMTPGTNSGL
jgi:hypothetical protein